MKTSKKRKKKRDEDGGISFDPDRSHIPCFFDRWNDAMDETCEDVTCSRFNLPENDVFWDARDYPHVIPHKRLWVACHLCFQAMPSTQIPVISNTQAPWPLKSSHVKLKRPKKSTGAEVEKTLSMGCAIARRWSFAHRHCNVVPSTPSAPLTSSTPSAPTPLVPSTLLVSLAPTPSASLTSSAPTPLVPSTPTPLVPSTPLALVEN